MPARWAVAVLVAGCLACGRHEDVYPPEVVENFMDACTVQGDRATCRCALDTIERRFTIDEFHAFETRMRAGEMPKEMIDAVSGCR